MAELLTIIALDFAEVTSPLLTALIYIFFLFLAKLYFNSFDLSSYSVVCLLF